MISETIKFLIDQALKYPRIREQLAKAQTEEQVEEILKLSGIHPSSSELNGICEYIRQKIQSGDIL